VPQRAHAQHDTKAPPHLLTLRETAELLRLSPSTLRNLVRRQLVPCYRFAGIYRLLFKPDEILALLQPTTPRPRLRRVTNLSHASDETPQSTLDDLFALSPSTAQADAQPASVEIPGVNGLVLTRED